MHPKPSGERRRFSYVGERFESGIFADGEKTR